MCSEFDDIRPYFDAEIPDAMRAVAEWELFAQVVRFIYPDMKVDEARRRLLDVRTVHDFQSTFMNDAIKRIIGETTSGFTCHGLHHLRKGKAYTFVSNHRDITLDAFLLQHVLMERWGKTSYIVFGQNLLAMPIIEVLFRSNKLIRMERGGNPRAFYRSLQHLSRYLNSLVVEQGQSVWIAQRNGRAKDGHDVTAPAIVKMLTLGSDKDALEALDDLNLVPMSISYEWDPCDGMKAAELYNSKDGHYVKAADEDVRSVVNGIIGKKGHVHLEIGKPLRRSDLLAAADEDLADHVAAVLDRRIQKGYKLMPTNYAASSLLGERVKAGRCTQRDIDSMQARAAAMPNAEMQRLLLEAYAAPVRAYKERGSAKN